MVTDEARASAYYGTFFMSIGAVMPFVAIWLKSIGISSTMSGFILAAPHVAIVLFTVIIGSWADKLRDWRSAIAICNVLVLTCMIALFVWQTPWGILVLWTLSGLFMIASSPIMDAATLDMTARRGSDYARIRAVGSIGFVVGILFAGKLFDSVGMHGFVWVLLAGSLLRVTTAITLPNFRVHHGENKGKNNGKKNDESKHTQSVSDDQKLKPFTGLIAGMALFKQPGIFAVIVGAALINSSHSFNNMYSVLHWTQTGISTTWASWLWTIAVCAEVALMWGFKSLSKRVSARHCLLVASAACVIRWLLTGLNPNLGVLIVLQCLHALTFSLTFLASINFIARRVSPNHAAQAQSVLATLSTLLMAIGTWVSAQFYDSWGGYSYWMMAILAFIGGGFIVGSYRTELKDTDYSSKPINFSSNG